MAKISVNSGQNSHLIRNPIEVDLPARLASNGELLLEVIAQAVADHLNASVTVHETGYQAYSLSPKRTAVQIDWDKWEYS